MDSVKEVVAAQDSCKEMASSCQDLADSCREWADSCKTLEAMAADLLSSWERFKVQQAAATSSPSTITTTPPPTSPLQAPATPGTDAPTNIESATDRPLQLSVVPKLAMPAPATCSTKCRDVLPKQCEVTSVVLSGTDVVQKAAVLPASCSTTTSSFRSVDDRAAVPVPEAGVLVAATRVPPHPPDLQVMAPEDYDTKVMETSLLGKDAGMPVPEQEKDPLASVILQPMTASVHEKEQDQERPMPWPSFVCWPPTSSLKPRQLPQGIKKKLVIEDMPMVLACLVFRYTLPNCSDGFSICFQGSFTGSQKMVVHCLALLPSITPSVCLPWHQPARTTHQAMISYIQSVAACMYSGQMTLAPQPRYARGGFSKTFVEQVSVMGSCLANKIAACLLYAEIMQCNASSRGLLVANYYKMKDIALFQWEITWPPPQGFCGTLPWWEAYFSIPQLRQMCSEQFGCVRKKCFAVFWMQPTSASNWESAFQLRWKLQVVALLQCILWIAKKHCSIMPCVGKTTYCKQYGTYQAALATTYVTLVDVLPGTNLTLCWIHKEESPICARVSIQLMGQSTDVSRARPNMRRYFVHELPCVNWQEFQFNSIQSNMDLLLLPVPKTIDVNRLEISIHNSKLTTLMSTHPGNHLHGFVANYLTDFPWIIAWSPSFWWSVFDFKNKHILLLSSVVDSPETAAVILAWQTTWSLHLDSAVPHQPYQLSQFVSVNLLEQEALPARARLWWLKFAVQRVFFEANYKPTHSGLYQFLHCAIYQHATDFALPWDPGGDFSSAWGQADFQDREYVMYQGLEDPFSLVGPVCKRE